MGKGCGEIRKRSSVKERKGTSSCRKERTTRDAFKERVSESSSEGNEHVNGANEGITRRKGQSAQRHENPAPLESRLDELSPKDW
jgi:hypothetical protein